MTATIVSFPQRGCAPREVPEVPNTANLPTIEEIKAVRRKMINSFAEMTLLIEDLMKHVPS